MSAGGPIKANVKTCVRCADEPAQRYPQSVFALGSHCLIEVMPRGTLQEMQAQYADLLAEFGWSR